MIVDERRAMIGTLNDLVDLVDRHTDEPIDLAGFARSHGTTEYHLRRMFAALAGLPFSEYVRRRRMTLAATDLVSGGTGLLDIAVRYGYSSVEAFGRAFRSVHGASPSDVRTHGGPFTTQAVLRFRLTVEGSRPMDVTITDRPAFVLAGHAAQVPLMYEGINPHIRQHIASIAPQEHTRLKSLNDAEPEGILAITDGSEPDAPEAPPRSPTCTELRCRRIRRRRRICRVSPWPPAHGPRSARPGPSPRRCRTHGLRPRPNGSRRIRGVCDPGPRSCATWS